MVLQVRPVYTQVDFDDGPLTSDEQLGFFAVISQNFSQCWNQVDPSSLNFYPHAKAYFIACLRVRMLKTGIPSCSFFIGHMTFG